MKPSPKSQTNSDGMSLEYKDSLSDEEWERRLMLSDSELSELGLLDRDELVISFNPVRRTK